MIYTRCHPSSTAVNVHFSTHISNLHTLLAAALGRAKTDLLKSLPPILSQTDRLYRTNRFDYWLRQLGETPVAEIPLTTYGLEKARSLVSDGTDPGRNRFPEILDQVCCELLTYSDPDDAGPCQSDYHYYIHIPTGTLYKESDLGMRSPEIAIEHAADVRIALRSELPISANRFMD